MSWSAALAQKDRYVVLLDRVEAKYARAHRAELLQAGAPTRHLLYEKDTLARLVARAVADESYRASSGTLRQVKISKMRSLFACDMVDFLVHGAVADVLTAAASEYLSDRVYSYKKGVSRMHALREFAGYVRRHRRSHPSPLDRGLFVLRRDVREYTDSIPVDRTSPLWGDLRALAAKAGAEVTPFTWRLIEEVVRPAIRGEGGEYCQIVGVLTGSPASPILANLYLTPLDRALEVIDGAFYARYGDDVLFVHPSADVTRAASGTIDEILEGRRLCLNREKANDLFFNGAGRPSLAWPDATPRNSVEFLGGQVTFHGTVGMKHAKLRELMTDLEARAKRCARALGEARVDVRGRAVCGALNRALDLRSPLASPTAAVLLSGMTDRRQLRDLDHRIARVVLSAVSGVHGVKAFREIPYRTLREDWQLVSLEHTRNTRGRP